MMVLPIDINILICVPIILCVVITCIKNDDNITCCVTLGSYRFPAHCQAHISSTGHQTNRSRWAIYITIVYAHCDHFIIDVDMPTIRQLTLLKSPTPIRILKKLALQWETLGYTLDFDPQGDHIQLIRKEHEREGLLSCCRKVLIHWLNGRGSYQPANWENLIEILEDMNEVHLARELRDMFSLH